MAEWTFFTNHDHVLVYIAADPGIQLRDIATQVRVTERAAQRTVANLVAPAPFRRAREGRRNRYQIRTDLSLRNLVEHAHHIGIDDAELA